MLSLSKTSVYAIMALSCLDPDGKKRVSVASIAEQTKISRPYLSKILNRLMHEKIVSGKRGYNGGVILAKKAKKISVMDISEAVDGRVWSNKCMFGFAECTGEENCPFHACLEEEITSMRKKLSDFTLDEVIRKKGENWSVGCFCSK